MRHRLSPSKLGLAEKCRYWANPAFRYKPAPPGRSARVGRLTHKMAELIACGKNAGDAIKGNGIAPESPEWEEIVDASALVRGPLTKWLDAWRDADIPRAAELSLRMDMETGAVRLYPRRGEPGYELPELHELGGEIDLIRNFGTHLEVIDLKTGNPRYFTESQLRGYAVLAANYYNVREVHVAFLRALKTKLTLTPFVVLDADELDIEHGRIRRTLRLLPESQPQPGDWCWACPAKKACPAQAEYGQVMKMELAQAGFFETSELAEPPHST